MQELHRNSPLGITQAEQRLRSITPEVLSGAIAPFGPAHPKVFRASIDGVSYLLKPEAKNIADPQNPPSELAAYELSKALHYGMVPPTRVMEVPQRFFLKRGISNTGISVSVSIQYEVTGNSFGESEVINAGNPS